MFFAAMYDIRPQDAADRIKELLEKMQLWDKRDLKLGSFSTGMKKRVQLVRVLLHRPELIFLDEPTAGLDPDSSAQVTDLIYELAKESGTTIFLCTHNLPLAERICDSFGFISKGTMVISGKKEQIIQSVIQETKVTILTTESEYIYTYHEETDINKRIRELLDQGKTILEVRRARPSLEDAYFHYIGRDEHGMV
jgi:ABC-2 type transport system ATP-binding protein